MKPWLGLQQVTFRGLYSVNPQARAGLDTLMAVENKLVIGRREGGWGPDGKGEGTEKCRLVVTKQPWGCEARHREHSQ